MVAILQILIQSEWFTLFSEVLFHFYKKKFNQNYYWARMH